MSLRQGALAPLVLVVFLLAACGRSAQGPAVSRLALTGAPSAQLIVEPDDGVKPVVQFIDAAQQSLEVAMYLLSDREVVNALESMERRGVRVRVMLEENPYGTGPGNRSTFDRLKSAGISMRWSPSTFQLSHDKYAIVDQKVALVGTANWTRSAFVDNREYLVVDTDAHDVAQLSTLFESDWNRQKPNVDDPHLVVSPVNSRADFVAMIGAARQTLHLEAEEIQDPQIEGALSDAAKRGVQVEVVIPRPTGGSGANESGRRRLVSAGVQVHQLERPYVHAKDIIVDGREAFVGSENISTSSLDENREVGILGDDSSAVQRLEDTFSRDWKAGQP